MSAAAAPAPVPGPPPGPPVVVAVDEVPVEDRGAVLELDGVHAGYRQFQALFGVSLRVAPRQAVALVGSNGAGKTTLARVATGLVVPTAGRVLVDGRDITGEPAHEIAAAGIAHAPEGRSVFATLSVEENLSLPFRRRFGRRGVAPALAQVYDLFPRLGERRAQLAGSLSGGEQRLVTLARVLVLEPRLLVADELSLGLDPINTDYVYAVLERILDAGTALLVIEQKLDQVLALADRVVVLDRGTVGFDGAPDEAGAPTASFLLGDGSRSAATPAQPEGEP
jgi:branched-chain amino acid transport system ATP-binding protein